MQMMKSLFLAGLGAAALAACSPFNPDLGERPYLCATAEPRCPADYTCTENGGREVCVQAGVEVADARPDTPTGFQCAPDGALEPNDMPNEAYQTDVGSDAPSRAFGPISICPEGDKDHYQINISAADKGIEVITRWTDGMAVSCSILNFAGTAISNCTAMGLNARRACVANLTTPAVPSGVFYARAESLGSMRNNYTIEMKVVNNCVQ